MITCCCCSLNPPSNSISKFISEQPYLSLLEKKCTTMKDLHKLHAQIIKTGLAKDFVAASRVLAFCSSHAGDINYAYSVFTQLENPNIFAWNTIIRGFSQSSTPQISISLFIDMLFDSAPEPTRLTYPSVFKAYAQLGLAHEGAQLHGRVVKFGLDNDQFIKNTIMNMYLNSGYLSEAQRIFERAAEFDVVTWNTMIMGLAKCGAVDESRRLFDRMLSRNTVSWNSMISGYARKGRFNEALKLFQEMQTENFRPSEFTMVSLLNACACAGAIEQGEWIHDYMIRNNFEFNSIVVTALIDMYSKCGSIGKAVQVFNGATQKGLSCWNSMILGLAANGLQNEAIELFSMLQSSSFKPDNVSFIGVLMACSYSGLVDKAKDYFLLMTETYKIQPSIKHYSCMVDALGRAGLLDEAEELIKNMPIKPDAIIWGTLLSFCKNYGKTEMAKRVAKSVMELDSRDSSSFVVMSNVYAATGQFGEAIEQRISLKEQHLEKEPGCSLIEVNGEVHEFTAGGRFHRNAREIYSLMDDLNHK